MAEKKIGIVLTASDQTRSAFDSARHNVDSMQAPLVSLNKLWGAVATGAVANAILTVNAAYLESEKSVKKLNAVLQSTGYAAGLTATELESIVQKTSRMQLINDDDVRDGVSALMLFRNVQGDVAKEAIRLGAEMTQLGGDMSSAMQQIGSALESPIDAGKKLKAMGIFVAETQQEMIEAMVEAGDTAAAQGMILDLLNQKYGDLSATMNTGAVADSKRLAIAWDELLETLGKIPGESGFSGWMATQIASADTLIQRLQTADGWRILFLGDANKGKQDALAREQKDSTGTDVEKAKVADGLRIKAAEDLQKKLEKFLADDERGGLKRIETAQKVADREAELGGLRTKNAIEQLEKEQAHQDRLGGLRTKNAIEQLEKEQEHTANLAQAQQDIFAALRQTAEDAGATDLQRAQLKQERQLFDLEQQRFIMANDHALTLAELEQFEQAKADIILANSDAIRVASLDSDKKVVDGKIQYQKMSLGSMGAFFGMAKGLMNSHSRSAFEIGKASAIAETVINTYKSATGAYSAMASIPFVGPALGVAAAAAAIASGMAQVAAIRSSSFGGSGQGGGSYGGATSATGGGYATPTYPSSPTPTATGVAGQAQQNVNITIVGNESTMFSYDQIVNQLIPAINQAAGNGVNIKVAF